MQGGRYAGRPLCREAAMQGGRYAGRPRYQEEYTVSYIFLRVSFLPRSGYHRQPLHIFCNDVTDLSTIQRVVEVDWLYSKCNSILHCTLFSSLLIQLFILRILSVFLLLKPITTDINIMVWLIFHDCSIVYLLSAT
ncbi:hypothetical protein L596_021465 [Steinernema carpocapsae]|uniref:Uncharacterized protein n=1 Tax=Steinernema carpocapsae TaxID=34508 RepID=A0A4U5MIV4_STECR|nr:hypothetical protein L596_021465 [Steinernema carpocapsae]